MSRKLEKFDEFNHDGWHVTTDIGSAYYTDIDDYDDKVIVIEGSATKNGEKCDVSVIVAPEDTPEFNNDISATEGELTNQIIKKYEGELEEIHFV